VLNTELDGKQAITYVDMLKPKQTDRDVNILSGDSSTKVFEDYYTVKSVWPEAKGTRIMVSPKNEEKLTEFATLFQMTEKGAKQLPVEFLEKSNYFTLKIADKIIVLAKPNTYLTEDFEIEVPKDKAYEVICLGLNTGFWMIKDLNEGKTIGKNVLKDQNAVSWIAKAGRYRLSPKRVD
jgi:heparin/heparan-sulfate lyase